MAKIKIGELAERHGVEGRALLKSLRDAGFRVQTLLSSVDEDKAEVFILRNNEAEREPESVDETVRIRKYENRRLYSAAHRRHLTLDDVADLVRAGRAVQIIDAADERDITSEILMQILIEVGRAQDVPVSLLRQMIRLQDEAIRSQFTSVLAQMFDMSIHMSQMSIHASREVARFYENWSGMRFLTNWFPGTKATSRAHSGFGAAKDDVSPVERALVADLERARQTITILEQKLSSYEGRAGTTFRSPPDESIRSGNRKRKQK